MQPPRSCAGNCTCCLLLLSSANTTLAPSVSESGTRHSGRVCLRAPLQAAGEAVSYRWVWVSPESSTWKAVSKLTCVTLAVFNSVWALDRGPSYRHGSWLGVHSSLPCGPPNIEICFINASKGENLLARWELHSLVIWCERCHPLNVIYWLQAHHSKEEGHRGPELQEVGTRGHSLVAATTDFHSQNNTTSLVKQRAHLTPALALAVHCDLTRESASFGICPLLLKQLLLKQCKPPSWHL